MDQYAELPRLAKLGPAWLMPEAVAACYAAEQPPAPDDRILASDLGRRRFDGTVLRATAACWQPVGEPAGLDQVGRADFDDAVLAVADDALGGGLGELTRPTWTRPGCWLGCRQTASGQGGAVGPDEVTVQAGCRPACARCGSPGPSSSTGSSRRCTTRWTRSGRYCGRPG